ncbi:MAG: hypothetical protein H0V29_09715 [Thermoleophilaceae bacterium]|nr:hypothetical protein [Thermoleophilaceae bacterium]
MTLVFALLGAKALYLMYLWLGSCVIASYLSDRKGYGEKPGLATGMLLSFIAIPIWLLWPARAESRWKIQGMIPRRGNTKTVAEARAEHTE